MEEKELKLILENHSLEIERKVDNKLHAQEMALRDMFGQFESKMLEAMDEQFDSQSEEIKSVLDGHKKQCETIFLKTDSICQFVKDKDLYNKTKDIYESIKEKNTISFSNQSNLIISVVKILSWFVMAVGFLILILLKLGLFKI